MTKLCGSCGRTLDDYARFCDRCGIVQPLRPVPQIEYQYPQPPQPTAVPPAGPTPSGVPVPDVVPQQPPRPEGEAVAVPSRAAVRVRRWTLRPLGRKPNYVGILGGILAFVGLIMPWWTETASVPFMSPGNSTAIDFPLYLYEASAAVLANPPMRVVTLDPWFCWATLALAALGASLAIVGSAVFGKGKWILAIGGVVALLSTVVFAAGFQSELSRTGSGVALFTAASGPWGTLTAYPSFGFWGAFVAAVVMLVAARRSAVVGTVLPASVESLAPEVARAEPRVGRPLGVTLLAAYCGMFGICTIAVIPFTSSLLEGIHQLPIGGLDLTYLWVLLVFSAVVDFVIAYGLLKRKKLVRTIVSGLSGLAVVGALTVIALLTVLMISPDLLGAGPSVSLTNGNTAAPYGLLAVVILLGIIVPLAVLWYMARPRVREYLGIAELRL